LHADDRQEETARGDTVLLNQRRTRTVGAHIDGRRALRAREDRDRVSKLLAGTDSR